jgi:hypothetical protein
VNEWKKSGVRLARLTHATGVSVTSDEKIDRLLPLPETARIPDATAREIRKALAEKRRVIAVGTGVVRALEGTPTGLAGDFTVTLKIGRGHRLKVVSGILSGLHELESSHLELLEAFAPKDQLLLAYAVEGVTRFQLDRDAYGLADVPLALGYQLRASNSGALAGWLSVKLPTGSVEELTGSGALVVALSLASTRVFGERGQAFAQLYLAWLGVGDLLPTLQEDYAWSALGGASWTMWRGLDLTAQLDANSGVLDSGLDDFDGGALVLSLGGTWRTPGGWRFDFGLSEDIQTDASPDVVFNLAARRDF